MRGFSSSFTPQLWMQGEARTISTRLLLIPDAVVQARLHVVLTTALHLLWRIQALPDEPREEGLVQCERLIARVEQLLQHASALSQAEEQCLRNRVSLLRGLAHMSDALREGDMQRLRTLAEQLQALTAGEQAAWKWLALYGLFVSAQWLGDAVLLLPGSCTSSNLSPFSPLEVGFHATAISCASQSGMAAAA